jgi:beta-N-acetylhexosaminidase
MAPPPPGSASPSSSRGGYSNANASHRYLKHAGLSTSSSGSRSRPRGERSPQNKRPKYHVTKHRRRPTIMAHTDNSDLDPSWQDLDRYVPTLSVLNCREPSLHLRLRISDHFTQSIRCEAAHAMLTDPAVPLGRS